MSPVSLVNLGESGYKVIEPELVPFISYPYEWSFSELKDAALLTLRIEEEALEHGMSLKDASAYNIQFLRGKPVLIDTLSFEAYEDGRPWVAYRQYCQHFLAPLALMAYADVRLQQLLKAYIDGVPLDLASRLLPAKTRFMPFLASHIHMHARSQQRYADKQIDARSRRMSRSAMKGLIGSLISVTQRLGWNPKRSEWGEYYNFTNYTPDSFQEKRRILEDFLREVKPQSLWDLGANTGLFSRIASTAGINTIAFDIDPAAVEQGYRQVKAESETNILPLVMDLTNPSPGLGWAHKERDLLMGRGPADMVFALALVHHLAISNNVPLLKLVHFLSQVGKSLVVEFVPKGDSQVDKLLATREDMFDDYHEAGFENALRAYFTIEKKERSAEPCELFIWPKGNRELRAQCGNTTS